MHQDQDFLEGDHYDALIEAGKIRGIVTQREAKKSRTRSGTITLGNRLLIDNLGFKEGDKFTVSKRKGSIILRKREG